MTSEVATGAESNTELVERCSFDPYTTGELDAIDEMVSENYVLHDPTEPEEIRGREGLKTHVESLRTAFPDLSASIEALIAEDDLVAVRFTTSGTYEKRLPGLDVEPTGETFEISGMEFDRIENGELVETWLAYDTLGFAQQLGAIPEDPVAQ